MLQTILASALTGSLVGGLVSLALHVLSRRQDERMRQFQVRYEQYQKYLAKIEEVTASNHAEFSLAMVGAIPQYMSRILHQPESSNAVIEEMVAHLGEMTARITQSFNKAIGELHGLKLVCSDQLLGKLNEFIAVHREQFRESIALMQDWRSVDPANPESSVTPEMKKSAERAKALFEEIVAQMRMELHIR